MYRYSGNQDNIRGVLFTNVYLIAKYVYGYYCGTCHLLTFTILAIY